MISEALSFLKEMLISIVQSQGKYEPLKFDQLRDT